MRRRGDAPVEISTFMDAYYCGKDMAYLLAKAGPLHCWRVRRARTLARRWLAGYERGFDVDYGHPVGARLGVDGHWRLNTSEEYLA